MRYLCVRASMSEPILKHFRASHAQHHDALSPDLHFVIHYSQLAHGYDCMSVCSKIFFSKNNNGHFVSWDGESAPMIRPRTLLNTPGVHLRASHWCADTILCSDLWHLMHFGHMIKKMDNKAIWWGVKKWQTADSDPFIEKALFWPVFRHCFGIWGIDQ